VGEETQGSSSDDLDHFFASARISTEVYATSSSKDGRFGAGRMSFREIGESRSEQFRCS
jgi:hypothetical protein